MNFVQTLRSITPRPEESVALPTTGGADARLEALQKAIGDFDMRRYGMPLRELQATVHDEALQREFPARYGISFEEYAERFIGGESMGESLKEGKFQPPSEASQKAAAEPENRSFIAKLVAHVVGRRN